MTARAILDLWPSRAALARDLGVARNLPNVWAQRGRIPDHAVGPIYAAARRRGLPVVIDEAGRLGLDPGGGHVRP